MNKLNKSFKTTQGILHVLKDLSFELKDGSCTVLAGENGSGKSLLMSIIAGLEKSDSGTIKVDGKVGLVFQEAETQILGETSREDIAFGPKNLGWKTEQVEAAVNKALEKTGLSSKADFPARFLSGGEKRRLAVACMLAMELPVIILDEPYANLDYTGVKQVNTLIKQLKTDGKTVIILTHEIEKCLALADNFIVLFQGQIMFNGSPEQGLLQPLETWGIRNPLVSYNSVKNLVW